MAADIRHQKDRRKRGAILACSSEGWLKLVAAMVSVLKNWLVGNFWRQLVYQCEAKQRNVNRVVRDVN